MASPAAAELVSPGAAQSVQGPSVGFCDATVTTAEERVDLSAWAGRYVTIYFEGGDGYIAFAATSVATIVLTAQPVGTVGVPLRIFSGTSIDRVVPKSAPVLAYRSAPDGLATLIRVVPS